MEKIKLPKKFILFNGSYSYWPNKQAIDLIINYFHKKILNKTKMFTLYLQVIISRLSISQLGMYLL